MTHEEEKRESERQLPLREWVDLKLKAFRSEMRLLIFASIAGNQILSHVSIPSTVTATAAGAGVAAIVKILLWR